MRFFDSSSADQWFSAWQRHLDEIPQSLALSDSNESLTFAQVDILSGKIYSKLLSLDAPFGSVALVRTSRGVRNFVAMLGILKRGFAYLLADPSMPEDRIDFIRRDSSAVCVIDDCLYEDIIANEPCKPGYEQVDDHVPAYLVYTSGTTGRPKGAIHERGNLLLSCKSMQHDGACAENRSTRFSLLCPLNFVVTTVVMNMSFFNGCHLFIPPLALLKDIQQLVAHLADNHIDTTFLPPAVLRLFGRELPKELTTIYTGSDEVGGIFLPGRNLFNLYMMSETGFVICKYLIDKPLPLCPIGKPTPYIDVMLSEEGEMLCKVPFFRGYVGTHSANVEGGYLRTGDLARIDKDGNYVLSGRSDDMVKVNGNRVEPAEVEAVVRELTGLDCAVRGYDNGGMTLAFYYVSDSDIDTPMLITHLKQRLPEYMIPSHFIRLECLPRTALGKLDRKNLPAPKTEYGNYMSPQSDFEIMFCKAIATELGLQRVGLHDDFFSLGGTSINILNIISKLNLKGFDAENFYKSRIVGDIIRAYLNSNNTHSLTEEEKEMLGRRSLQPLEGINNDVPRDLAEAQLATGNMVWNLPQILQLPWFADMKRLCRAINAYISSSSTFQTDITRNSDGKLCYRFHPELVKAVSVECMSVSEANEAIRTFVRPFPLLDTLPYRIRLIRAGLHKYLLFDIHHIFTDGEGLALIGSDILNLYRGGNAATNNLFAWIADEKAAHTQDELKMNMEALKRHFDGTKWGGMLGTGTGQNRHIKYTVNTGVCLKNLNSCLAQRGWTRDSLLYASFFLAAAKLSQSNDVLAVSLYGRRAGVVNHAGMRFCCLNLGIHLVGIKTAGDLIAAVEHDRVRAMAYTAPAFKPYGDSFPWYLDDLGDIANIGAMFGGWVKSIDPFYDPKYDNGNAPTDTKVIRFSNHKGFLCMSPDYNTFYASEEEVCRLCDYIIVALKRLISGDDSVIAEFV